MAELHLSITGHRARVNASWLPMLIHGSEGSGASLATIVLAAEEVRAERPVVFLSRWPMAVKRLQDELGLSSKPEVATPSLRSEVASPLAESRLVTMHGQASFLLRSLRALPHWQDRMVVVKNCDETLSPDLWAVIQDHPQLVLSGDLSQTKIDVTNQTWKTMLAFSKPPKWFEYPEKAWPKYLGLLKRGGDFEELLVAEESI